MIITGKYPNLRMRRSRKNSWSRRLVQENSLSYNDLILPIFLTDGSNKKIPIKSMPNIYRYSIDKLSKIIDKFYLLSCTFHRIHKVIAICQFFAI